MHEFSLPFAVTTCSLAASIEFVFVDHHSLQSDRSAGVGFTGTDTNLRTKSVTEAVGKPGRGILENTGRINFVHEPFGSLMRFGDNGIGMIGTVTVDVLNRFFQSCNRFYRKDHFQVFGFPVFF